VLRTFLRSMIPAHFASANRGDSARATRPDRVPRITPALGQQLLSASKSLHDDKLKMPLQTPLVIGSLPRRRLELHGFYSKTVDAMNKESRQWNNARDSRLKGSASPAGGRDTPPPVGELGDVTTTGLTDSGRRRVYTQQRSYSTDRRDYQSVSHYEAALSAEETSAMGLLPVEMRKVHNAQPKAAQGAHARKTASWSSAVASGVVLQASHARHVGVERKPGELRGVRDIDTSPTTRERRGARVAFKSIDAGGAPAPLSPGARQQSVFVAADEPSPGRAEALEGVFRQRLAPPPTLLEAVVALHINTDVETLQCYECGDSEARDRSLLQSGTSPELLQLAPPDAAASTSPKSLSMRRATFMPREIGAMFDEAPAETDTPTAAAARRRSVARTGLAKAKPAVPRQRSSVTVMAPVTAPAPVAAHEFSRRTCIHSAKEPRMLIDALRDQFCGAAAWTFDTSLADRQSATAQLPPPRAVEDVNWATTVASTDGDRPTSPAAAFPTPKKAARRILADVLSASRRAKAAPLRTDDVMLCGSPVSMGRRASSTTPNSKPSRKH
jgi:hypothetical protein